MVGRSGIPLRPPGWHRRAWEQLQEYARSWQSSDRIVRDYFQGGHEIYFIGALDFLNRFLRPELGSVRGLVASDQDGSPTATEPAQPGFLIHKFDSGKAGIIRGSFHVSASDAVFSGLAFRLARTGMPGDLLIKYGSEDGGADLGTARVNVTAVPIEKSALVPASITPTRLKPGKRYFYEISAEWGWIGQGDYYAAYGPAPLGGEPILPNFGISMTPLTEGLFE